MTATYEVAQDEMRAVFNLAWLAGSAALAGYVPEVRWPGNEVSEKPGGDKFWSRWSSQGVAEEQTSLSACMGETNNASRHTANGLIFVQLFCPKSVDTSFAIGQLLAKLVRNAYKAKKTASGVVFRNARIQELQSEELWHRFNVVAEYEYDEFA